MPNILSSDLGRETIINSELLQDRADLGLRSTGHQGRWHAVGLQQAQDRGDPRYFLVALNAFTGIDLVQDYLALLFSEMGEEGHERVFRGTPIHTLHKIFLRQMHAVFPGKLPPERRDGMVGIHNHPIHIEKNRFVHHLV